MSMWFSYRNLNAVEKRDADGGLETGTVLPSFISGFIRRLISRVRRSQLEQRRTGTSYIAIERIARAVASLDLRLLKQVGWNPDGTARTAPLERTHWLNMLREHPSGMGAGALEYMTFEEIVKQIVRWRKTAGAAFLWTWDGTSDGSGRYPVRMTVLPPTRVEIVSERNVIDHYILHTTAGERKLSRREVCYLPMLSTFDDLHESLTRGYAPADAVEDAIEAEEAMTQFMADYHREGMMPPVIFESSGSDAEQFDPSDTESPRSWNAFVRRWRERFRGRNRQQIGKIPHGWTAKVIDLVTNMQGFTEIAHSIGEQVIQTFGIPLSMLRGNAANYATARVDNYIFRVDEVEPEATTIYRVLSRHFRKYEPDVLIEHIPAIDEDPEQTREDERHLFAAAALTPNELRERHGLARSDNPAMDRYYLDNNPLPDNSPELIQLEEDRHRTILPEETAATANNSARSVRDWSDEELSEYLQSLIADR